MGDLNGKTNLGEDFVRDDLDKHSPINVTSYKKDTYICRKNMDNHPIDTQGKTILNLCKYLSLRILNGRTEGDPFGQFTRYPSNLRDMPSAIDYALCSESIRQDIISFNVHHLSPISDHCCISIKIKTNYNKTPKQSQSPNENHHIGIENNLCKLKYTYDKNLKHLYAQALLSDTKVEKLNHHLKQPQISSENIEEGLTQLNDILFASAKKSCFIQRFKNNRKHKKRKTHEWFNKDCKTKRTILRQHSKDWSKNPFNVETRHKYVCARSIYKKACRKSEKLYRENLTNNLMKIGQNDPKKFWCIINKMNHWGKEKTDPADAISPMTWINHFKGLLNNSKQTNAITEVSRGVNTFDPILDSRISAQELQEALANLKIGKAPGPDGIPVEYIKVFGQLFEPILLKLMRLIFAENFYPLKWTVNFLKPIYKKGCITDPGNYRGLAIGSALSKLHSIILLNRLTKYIEHKGLISPNQIGFMKGSGASDHIFLLQTIIEKVVKKDKKRLYAAFIDFKKAYDTVNRDILIKRLKTLGINGIFLRNIVAMYSKTEYSLKIKGGHTKAIHSNLGLKQGCPLSPMLFNLYIDDINSVLDDACDPIEFQNIKINQFLYADDLVIISQSKEGLQRCLNKLYIFAETKDLTISINKSKTMTFNHAGIFIHDSFALNTQSLEQVNTFCYLGFDVKSSGIVNHAMRVLNDKANKALRPLFTAFARFNLPAKIAIRLFHTFIVPILLYNVENWAILSDKKLTTFNNDTLFDNILTSKTDLVHRKILKFVTGVSKSCPNLAMYGETGEIPLSLKGYRLTLNYWHRLTNMPDRNLAKKALLENIKLRTNWIITIEKLLNRFNLTDKIGNHKKFKETTKCEIDKAYLEYWNSELSKHDKPRLKFYGEVKDNFKIENYLEIENFQSRKAIAKLRCSDHTLEIERGRHLKIDRERRICRMCDMGAIETEKHFLLECNKYEQLRNKFNTLEFTTVRQLINNSDQIKLGNYLVEAFKLKSNTLITN